MLVIVAVVFIIGAFSICSKLIYTKNLSLVFQLLAYTSSNYFFIVSSGVISDLVVHVVPDHNCDSIEVDGIGVIIED